MAFADTRWSLVLRAGIDSDDGRQALNSLCRQYEKPLKSYLLRRGFSVDAAEELLQSFFLKLVEGNFVEGARPERGRFRNFLITALRRSIANDHRFARTIKRGRNTLISDLDDAALINLHEQVPGNQLGPDQAFDRDWALELLNRSICLVEEKYRLEGKSNIFEILKDALVWNSDALDREAAAASLDVQPGHLRVLIFRLREEFRSAVRQEILNTVAELGDVDDELRELALTVSARWRL